MKDLVGVSVTDSAHDRRITQRPLDRPILTTQRRAERQGVNPRNPTEKVTIPAATVPKFTAGSQLKQAVKSGGAGA